MAYGTGPIDWIIRLVVTLLLIFTFSCILLRPLWKLTASRPSLIIVFSRAIGNFLRLVGNMPNFIILNILKIPMESDQSYFWAYATTMNAFTFTMLVSPHVHNLALAVNRLHAMFFPFHYNMVFPKKKNIYALCLGLWLICICVSGSEFLVGYLNIKFSPVSRLNTYSMYTSGLCYAALGSRMIWIRYKSTSTMSGASTEKDSIKILVVCFACLAMSAMFQLIFQPFATYANANFSDTPRLAVYWGSYTTQWMILCTEEICLALLVRDFRRDVIQQLRTLFFCCCRDSSNIDHNSSSIMYNNNSTATRTVKAIRMVQVTKVNTLVVNSN